MNDITKEQMWNAIELGLIGHLFAFQSPVHGEWQHGIAYILIHLQKSLTRYQMRQWHDLQGAYRGVPKWSIGTKIQMGSIINMSFHGRME